MNVLDRIEKKFIRDDVPHFRPGDLVRVHVRIREGEKERIQVFEGNVIKKSGGSARETFTVRKISYGVGVERVFPVHSPRLAKIEVVAFGRVRRAKLYYLRKLRGKKARVKTRRAPQRQHLNRGTPVFSVPGGARWQGTLRRDGSSPTHRRSATNHT